MIRAILNFFGFLFAWATNGLVLLALSVGAVLWIYARDLPNHTQLAQYAPPTISRIYSAEGRLMDEFAHERRLFVPAAEIPDLVKQAFISAEDKNFYLHKGYDVRGMAAAFVDAVRSRGETLRGASTITQQVMKNFLLSGDRTAERKIKEIILAARIEQTLTKEQILELYLNEIFLGQNSYGVAAAAQTYFSKALTELDLEEAAFLAALPQAPSNYHPVRAKERVTERRNFVLRQMQENGYITAAARDAAIAAPLRSVQNGDFPAFREGLPPRGYFTDEIRRQLSERYSEEEFFTGGLAIRATLDPVLQEAAERAFRKGLEEYDRRRGRWRGGLAQLPSEMLEGESWRAALADLRVPRDIDGWQVAAVLRLEGSDAVIGIEGEEALGRIPVDEVTWARRLNEDGSAGPKPQAAGDIVRVGDVVHVAPVLAEDGRLRHWSLRQIPELQGAFLAMDVNTGRVLAMQGGFSYQDSVFNRATQALRQPGSAFKPLVYAAALDSGYTPGTIVIDAPIEMDTGSGEIWRPQNASGRFYGPTPLRTGIERSRNLMTVRLAEEVGLETVARYAERFGVYDRMQPYVANALGSQETTMLRIVRAYAMLANGGEFIEPTLVDRVQDRLGRTIFRHDARICADCAADTLPPGRAPAIRADRRRVIDPVTAYQVTSMLEGVVQRGTAAGRVNLPVPVAGKTGTTNDALDVWFVGFTSNIVAGCYMGFDQPRSIGADAYGGTMCAPVFDAFMKVAVEHYGGGPFRVPPGSVFVKMDRYTGERLPDDAEGEHVVAELFHDGMEPMPGFQSVIDGGYAIGSDLMFFERGEYDDPDAPTTAGAGGGAGGTSFGSMSSGGTY